MNICRNKEYALVPIEDIERLENARKRLIELTFVHNTNLAVFLDIISYITPVMHNITHQRYLKVSFNQIQQLEGKGDD